MPARPITIIGNWKMHKTISEAIRFVTDLAPVITQTSFQVGLAVPFTALAAAAQAAQGTRIAIGAQNVSDREEGAYTGEISPAMIRDAGASFVLVGHSERRRLFHEEEGFINRKIVNVLNAGIRPICCIGETLEEHQAGKTKVILRRQLLQSLKGLQLPQLALLTIAYEPVWAIGTNQAATPEIAQAAQAFCRDVVAQEWGAEAADRMQILYGGSANPMNAASLLAQLDIDGLLVGNASLSVDSFAQILSVENGTNESK